MAKPIYALRSGDDCLGIVWETKLGKFITFQGCINPQMGLEVIDCETGTSIDYIDMVDVLSEILPMDLPTVEESI